MIVEYDKGLKPRVLEAFNLKVDEDKYLIDKDTNARVEDAYGNPIPVKKFAGVRKGSTVFIKSDLTSLIELSKILEPDNGSTQADTK